MYQIIMAKPVLGRLSLNGLLALAGIAGPFILLVANLVAAQSALSYSPLRDSISSLAWARMGWVQTLGFVAVGLLVEVFTAGLFLGMRGMRGVELGIVLLACFGFGLLLVGAFHTNIPGVLPTIDGTIHGIAANTVFLLLPLASLIIAPSLKKNSYWRPLFTYSVAAALFALIWIAIYRLWLPAELSWFGLYEWVLVVDEVIWVEVTAIWLLRLSLRFVRNTQPALNNGLTPNTEPTTD